MAGGGVGDALQLAVVFLDATTGWAAGEDGTILHTTDGGLTWSPQDAGTSEGLTALAFVSPDERLGGGRQAGSSCTPPTRERPGSRRTRARRPT